MSYSYHQAAKIIGCFPATVRRIADDLGMKHHRGGSSPAFLGDEDVIQIWEAIEAKRNARAMDSSSEDRTEERAAMELSARPLVDKRSEESADTPTQVRENVGAGLESASRKCAKPVIIGGSKREPDARSPHFSVTSNGAQLEPARPCSDEESSSTDEELRARIDQLALRELDAEIQTREMELATMRRAREVLAKGTTDA